MSNQSLTVFFPCYNEESNLERVVKKAIDFLNTTIPDFEIIIVDDGSVDLTGLIADSLARKNSRIKVIHHPQNKGYGAALQSGFRNATKDLVFYTDGDGQFDITELNKLMNLIGKHEIVTGYRVKRRDSLIRKVNAALWNILVTIVFGLRLRDINCAFKLFKREIFQGMELKSNGAFINAEIFARAKKKGFSIAEVGVNHYPRISGKQTGANLKVILKAFKELWRLKKELR